jgi:Tir chaperone protein (CesT) family
MTDLAQVQGLFEEIGPELDVLGVIQMGQDQWVLVYEEQLIVEINHDGDRKCLTIGVELGEPDPERQLETCQSMLTYSGMGDRTGGIRIALDSPFGCLIQLLDLFTEELDRVMLITVLGNFVETARSWRGVLTGGGISLEDIAQPDASEAPPEGIRV